MIGLLAIIVLVALLAIAVGVSAWTRKSMLRSGWSQSEARVGAIVAVALLSLPITWDAIPTWIAFEYYAHKEVGIQVLKTLKQWNMENPGVAQTLEPYGLKDKRGELKNLGGNKFRYPLNDRFVYDHSKEKLFLSVYAVRYELLDRKNETVLVRHTRVISGNGGGIASGGPGWWAFWLVHKTPDAVSDGFFSFVESTRAIGEIK